MSCDLSYDGDEGGRDERVIETLRERGWQKGREVEMRE